MNAPILVTILISILLHDSMLAYVDDVLLELQSELIDNRYIISANTHYHISHIILPSRHITLSFLVCYDGLLSPLANFFILIELRNVAFVDILNVFFAD